MAVTLLLGFAAGAEKYVFKETHTKTFASHKYHGFPILDEKAKGGVAGGFALLCGLMLFAIFSILRDEIVKHKEYKMKLLEAQNKMRSLGMDIAKIDEEYEVYKKTKGK